MDMEMAGKNAVVTGASKGIGLAIAQALADAGAHVVGGSRSLSTAFGELVEAGRATFVQGDLSQASGPADLVAAAVERGGVDILVNSVGAVTPRPDGFLSITDDDWNTAWTLGLMTAVRTTRAAVPAMVDGGGGGGVIVMMGSVNAFLPDPLVLDYSVVKAALTNFAKGLSKELGPRGVRVVSVSPGPVETDLWLGDSGVARTMAERTGKQPQDIAASAVAGTPLGRFSTPREVADLVTFLAGARAANITGADVTIDGGMITTMR
ncbi:SDR family oxidoreductase [Actinacidiphila acidipaludis]|uniref:SDR family oxidoreductase n=1 Tax=Actinacidiphila acidipaludis TaxID=2873382 RepID=A0ABS7Q8Q0_9ACTN|nr:SDR family oxidoreductase [Streptomyces acidipaludis]MBY8879079.1 SDR family oxidoreductase [Streptomyces acidipaludis]